jgi:hypothetical protein
MKTLRESRYSSTILNLKMEASGQFHMPTALSSVKEPSVPTGQEAAWAPEPVWMLWRREKSLVPVGN